MPPATNENTHLPVPPLYAPQTSDQESVSMPMTPACSALNISLPDDMSSASRIQIIRQIRRLQLVCFFVTLSVVLPAPSFPYYFTKHLSLSSSAYGLIVGASSLFHLAAAIIYGRSSDHWGRRKVLIFQAALGFVLYTTFAAIVIFTDTYRKANSILIFILLGCSNTANLLTCSAVCDLCLPMELQNPDTGDIQVVSLASERPKFLAQVAGVVGLAAAVGPILGQTLQRGVSLAPESPVVVLLLAALANVAGGAVAYSTRETNVSTKAFYKPVSSEASEHVVTTVEPAKRSWWMKLAICCSPSCICCGLPEVHQSQSCAKSENSFQKRANSPLLECTVPAPIIDEFLPKTRSTAPQVMAPSPAPIVAVLSTDSTATRPSLGEQNCSCEVQCIEPSKSSTEESTKIDISLDPEDDRPDWNSLKYIYICQLLKAFSLTSVTVCYALVLDLLLPSQWLFGLKSEQTIAIALSVTSFIRVSIQLGGFQHILTWMRGPGVAFLVGCILMSVGQLATYWTIADLPRMMNLSGAVESKNTLIILTYACLHFVIVGLSLNAGVALAEPSLSALLALGVADHKSYQGLAQGFYSAINQLGATLGPPVMGWLLAMRSIASSYGPDCGGGGMILPASASTVQLQHEGPVLIEAWQLNPIELREETLTKIIPSLPVSELWDITADTLNVAIPSDGVVVPSLVYQPSVSIEPNCLAQTARPLLPFIAGAVLAVLPLALWKRVLRLSRGWEK